MKNPLFYTSCCDNTKITNQITIKIYCQYAVTITLLSVNLKNVHNKKSFNLDSKHEVFWSNLSHIFAYTRPLPVTRLPLAPPPACQNPVRYKYTTHPIPCHTSSTCLWRWNWQRAPKRRLLALWRRGITQKKTYYNKYFVLQGQTSRSKSGYIQVSVDAGVWCLFLVVTILRFQFPHILVRILQIVVAYFLQDLLQVHLKKEMLKYVQLVVVN